MKTKLALTVFIVAAALGVLAVSSPVRRGFLLMADSRFYVVHRCEKQPGQPQECRQLTSGKWRSGQTKYVYEAACRVYEWNGKKDKCVEPKPLPFIKRPHHCRFENGCWKQSYFPIP
jgi:hypothetical protein